MKQLITLILLLLAATICRAQFTYINPMPGTVNHNPETNIILKCAKWINKQSVQSGNLVTITGSTSGNHPYTARLSDDRKTVVIKPLIKFACDETVTVIVNSNLLDVDGNHISGTSFTFGIRKEITPDDAKRNFEVRRQSFIDEYRYDPWKKERITRGPQDTIIYLDSMPHYTININDNPYDGQIFFNNHEDQVGPDPNTNSFTTIINNNGSIVWARDVGKEGHDFKINANGYLTYFITLREIWLIMDSSFNIIDSVQCKNGYESSTNEHDMMIYKDGHVFLIAYDNETTDMTAYGGPVDAKVQYCVLQELDSARDVVFEWRSNDPGHFLFTDANQYTSLSNSTVDYVHCNTIWRDSLDGNIVISCRNMDEVTKINNQTGDIIWRWGGENNQFTFINDNNVKHFASQHDVQRIANGHFTMFNNANHMVPLRSSAKEYDVDEINKTATLTWYYEHPDVNGIKVYGSATGSVQRLPNGNTMIDWGLIPWGSGVPNQTEVDSLGNIRWEMTWDSVGQKSYRVHKYKWNPCIKTTYYLDSDNDGFGNSLNAVFACPAPAGYVADSSDCNDADANIHPGAGENCSNGIDDNCNNIIDEGSIGIYYADSDLDGYGDLLDQGNSFCTDPGSGYSVNNEDCNDANASINPAASEVCNGLDDNCNGNFDEGLIFTTFFQDNDLDGYGDLQDAGNLFCSDPGSGYSMVNSDCNDSSAIVNPSANEICNNTDDNCNGATDEGLTLSNFYADSDGDGFGTATNVIASCMEPVGYVSDSTDCDDSNIDINPLAIEIAGNGIDDNCNGYVDEFGTAVSSIISSDVFISVSPNPFSTTAIISFSLPLESHVSIELFDVAGVRLKELRNQNLKAGEHQINLNREWLSAGFYILKMQVGEESFIRKVVVK